jgi:hypothetical protein
MGFLILTQCSHALSAGRHAGKKANADEDDGASGSAGSEDKPHSPIASDHLQAGGKSVTPLRQRLLRLVSRLGSTVRGTGLQHFGSGCKIKEPLYSALKNYVVQKYFYIFVTNS